MKSICEYIILITICSIMFIPASVYYFLIQDYNIGKIKDFLKEVYFEWKR